MDSFLKIPLCIYASIPMYYTLYKYVHVHGGGAWASALRWNPLGMREAAKGKGRSQARSWAQPHLIPPAALAHE